MTLLHQARVIAQRFGIDVNRFPECSYDYHIVQLLLRSRIDVVLDVGANCGQYGSLLRRFGYQGRIASFEPVHEPLQTLFRRTAADPLWTVFPHALGDERATVAINVAGNGAASSSVLPMLPRHAEACPESRYVEQQEVEQHRLDAIWPQVAAPDDRVFLKLDVQGYEEAVLRGAGDRLHDCAGLQMEVSFVPLYEGELLLGRALDLVQHQYGLTLMALVPGFTDPRTGQMLQCDAVFFRDELPHMA
ncbi:FkbM family methyltransferase [Streptomyces sp. CoH27]|uniref:FkbM family methyltransferase n=1 Tax=Streptomyces sp. CoH27 TaxID=2875763 RepID=UPI001CD64653|nr:FkbM family methyltransferase [Streptomyces sp. CoH27]